MNFLNTLLIIFILFLNDLIAQSHLEWINRTGTKADSIFFSRVYFHADHFYSPITKYNNFPYSNDNEFELNRLKNRHKTYQNLFNSLWRTGFLLQIPVKAEGQTDFSSIAVVGEYDFTNEKFPFKFQNQILDFPLMNDEVDLKKLYKKTNVKEPKYTDWGKVVFKLQPIEFPHLLAFLNVPIKYAESFKTRSNLWSYWYRNYYGVSIETCFLHKTN